MKPKLLVLAKTLPLHDRASGDYRLFRLLEAFTREFEVDFLSTTHAARSKKTGRLHYLPRDSHFHEARLDLLDQKYIDDLRSIGVNPLNQAAPVPFTVRPGPRYDIRSFLEKQSYDVVWVEFYYLAAEYLGDIRRLQPQARLICDSVDLHFRRLARQCNYFEAPGRYAVNSRHEKRRLSKSRLRAERRHADHVRDEEIAAYKKCDAVVLVSEDDREELLRHCPQLTTLLVPNIHKPPARAAAASLAFANRHGCVFVGNFDHEPNVRSCVFLKHEVAPHLGKIPIQIVGSNPSRVVRALATAEPRPELFEVTGQVPDTFPFLENARVSVAPILFGAGMNGKIGEALSAGLPVVTTSLGALGMQLEHEVTCLVADGAEDFARAIERLHEDEALWSRLRENGLRHVEKLCSPGSLAPLVTALVPPQRAARKSRPKEKSFVLPAPEFTPGLGSPKFSVIVLAHNQWPFTELCLRSLAYADAAHPGLAEYLIVDNGSSDSTTALGRKIPGLRVISSKENLGFAAGNNRGIEYARGEHVILLNNDTIVPPDWLERFSRHVDMIPNLAILGPSTNTESGQKNEQAAYGSVRELFALNQRLEPGAWQRTEKISGLCLVLTRLGRDRLGLLDTTFGKGYFEDDDLCLRAQDAGLSIAWAQDVYVHHFGSVSFRGTRKGRARLLEEGMARFAFKWGKRGLDHIAKQHKESLLLLGKT